MGVVFTCDTEFINQSKYSKRTGTNIYAASMRGVNKKLGSHNVSLTQAMHHSENAKIKLIAMM